MFDFDAGKLLIVGVIALIFIPPKDLPRVLRQVGQFVGKMRRMAAEFQGQFMDAMRDADMADLRREAEKLAEAARVETRFPSVRDIESHMTGAVDATPSIDALPKSLEPAEDAAAFEALQTELRPLVKEPADETHPPSAAPDHMPHTAG